VSDQGIGIEPSHLDSVFDRFYQVDSASTRRVGGSGLGLSICKAIVEAHNGTIWVESQSGRGSTFYFTLPLAHSEESPKE
jgi:signal transduction histidine kinase